MSSIPFFSSSIVLWRIMSVRKMPHVSPEQKYGGAGFGRRGFGMNLIERWILPISFDPLKDM